MRNTCLHNSQISQHPYNCGLRAFFDDKTIPAVRPAGTFRHCVVISTELFKVFRDNMAANHEVSAIVNLLDANGVILFHRVIHGNLGITLCYDKLFGEFYVKLQT